MVFQIPYRPYRTGKTRKTRSSAVWTGGLKNVKAEYPAHGSRLRDFFYHQSGFLMPPDVPCVENPYAPSVCGNQYHIISWLDHQVMHIGGWQVTQNIVTFSSVPAKVYTYISTHVKDVFINGIFAYHIYGPNWDLS